jgi:RimJ/RimL family protein N-acetyltransferase
MRTTSPEGEGVRPEAMKVENSTARVGLPARRDLTISGEKTVLRAKKMSDARNDYRWQSDPDLARLDATRPLRLSFTAYLLDYSVELRSPGFRRYPLAIDTIEGAHIGNCTLYDIDEKQQEAQLGILIGNRDYWDKGYGTDAVSAVTRFVFTTTTLQRLYLKSLDWNLRAHRSFDKCGFTPTGFMKRHEYNFKTMELTRERWKMLNDGHGNRPS